MFPRWTRTKNNKTMKKVDIWLDEPITISDGETEYPNVVHIDTMRVGDQYIEDENGEILFLDEMELGMVLAVKQAVENALQGSKTA